MDQHERHKKLNSELGAKLTNFLGNALVDASDLPGKSALRAMVEEEFGDVAGLDKDKLYDAFVGFAQRGQDRSKRFELRGIIYETVVNVVTKLEEADRLMPVEEASDEEIAAATAKAADPYADRIGGELQRKVDQERAEAREILRKAGQL
jgi:hypothetical protein